MGLTAPAAEGGRQYVAASDAVNMLGPYLTCEAKCPRCGADNVLTHVEGTLSLVRSVDACGHLRAVRWDEDGRRWVEFEVGGAEAVPVVTLAA